MRGDFLQALFQQQSLSDRLCVLRDFCFLPVVAAGLIAPIALNQVRAVSCQSGQKSLSAELAQGTTRAKGILAAHAKLNVSDTDGK